MGKQKKGKTKAFAAVKRMISPKDARIKKPAPNPNQLPKLERQRKDAEVRNVAQTPASLFFSHNMSLGPPYHVLIDTNFINFSIQNKLDIMKSLMDCLYAKAPSRGCHPRAPLPAAARGALLSRWTAFSHPPRLPLSWPAAGRPVRHRGGDGGAREAGAEVPGGAATREGPSLRAVCAR